MESQSPRLGYRVRSALVGDAPWKKEMIRFVSGDLLSTDTQYIAQGVATGSQEGLGTGLALKISKKWPDVQARFKRYTRNHSFEGGDLFVVDPDMEAGRPGVIYIATQPDMYHATMSYLRKGIRSLAKYCDKNKVESVSLPKIGAGLGKLDWESEVKPLLVEHLSVGATRFEIIEHFRNEFETSTSRTASN